MKRFKIQHVVALTAHIIKKAGDNNRIDWLRAQKFLYLTERNMLEIYNKRYVYDKFYSTHLGPMLSNTYNLMRGVEKSVEDQKYWDRFFTRPDKNYAFIGLKLDIEFPPLDDDVKEVCDSIIEVFKQYNTKDFVEVFHALIPEWNRDVGKSSEPIKIGTIKQYLDPNYRYAVVEKEIFAELDKQCY